MTGECADEARIRADRARDSMVPVARLSAKDWCEAALPVDGGEPVREGGMTALPGYRWLCWRPRRSFMVWRNESCICREVGPARVGRPRRCLKSQCMRRAEYVLGFDDEVPSSS